MHDRLDLDDVGAQFGEHPAELRSDRRDPELHDPQAVEQEAAGLAERSPCGP